MFVYILNIFIKKENDDNWNLQEIIIRRILLEFLQFIGKYKAFETHLSTLLCQNDYVEQFITHTLTP